MNEHIKSKRISNFIIKDITEGLNPKEQEELHAWLNDHEDNMSLYKKIRNSKNYSVWADQLEQVDTESGWERFYSIIKRKKRISRLTGFLKYAAIIMFPVIMVVGINFFISEKNKVINETSGIAEIKPGTTKAVLILSDGKSVVLDSLQNKMIKEEDGTLIKKDFGNISYNQKTKNIKAELLYNTIYIPQGGEYHLVLSDSTEVFLNSMSQLKFPVQFTGKAREVELTGEAYFIVTKDANKPFTVKTGKMNIEVLGTSFNINAYEETGKVITTLVEGRVQLQSSNNPSETRILLPDEQAIYLVGNGQMDVNKVDVSLYTGWRNGQIAFYNDRLEDIMITLARWYSINVIYLDSSVMNLRFGGSLDRYGDIFQILDIIKSTNKVDIEINKNTIVFSVKK